MVRNVWSTWWDLMLKSSWPNNTTKFGKNNDNKNNSLMMNLIFLISYNHFHHSLNLINAKKFSTTTCWSIHLEKLMTTVPDLSELHLVNKWSSCVWIHAMIRSSNFVVIILYRFDCSGWILSYDRSYLSYSCTIKENVVLFLRVRSSLFLYHCLGMWL